MADVKNAPATEEYNDDGTKNPDYVAPAGGESGESDTKNKDDDKGEDEGGDDSKKDDFDDEATPVIPVRKSVAQHIIARKNEKIKKLESKAKADDDGGADDDAGDDDSNLSDDARNEISTEVEKRIKPLQDAIISKADEDELKDLFSEDPNAKKYEKHIKAYMQHESYKGVSPTVIYHHLAFNASKALGAKEKKVADKEADLTKNGGRGLAPKGSVSDLPTPEDIENMTEAEFEAMETDARQGKYINKK